MKMKSMCFCGRCVFLFVHGIFTRTQAAPQFSLSIVFVCAHGNGNRFELTNKLT